MTRMPVSPRTRHGSVAGRGSATDWRQQSDTDLNQHKRVSLDILRELRGCNGCLRSFLCSFQGRLMIGTNNAQSNTAGVIATRI